MKAQYKLNKRPAEEDTILYPCLRSNMGFRPVAILMEIEGYTGLKFSSFRYRKLGDI